MDGDDGKDAGGELAKSARIGIKPFPPLLIPESALPMFPLQLPLPLLPPPPSSPSLPSSPMFLLLSFPPPSSSRLLLPPTPDLPLRPPCILLRRDLDPNPDLDLCLNLFVDAPEAVVPLDFFLSLIRGDLDLGPDLVLTSKEDHPIPLPSSYLPSFLLGSPSLRLQQSWPPPPIRPADISAAVLHRFYRYLAGGPPPLVFR